MNYYISHIFTNNVYHAIFEIQTFLEQIGNTKCNIFFEHLDKSPIALQLIKLNPNITILDNSANCIHLDFKEYKNLPSELYIKIRNNYSYLLEDTIDTNKKIYISRKYNSNVETHKNISARHIVNEDELFEHILKPRGFHFICMEDLTILEQLKLFTNAKTIISPHGSALTYSLFANKNTQIIEILPVTNDKHFFSDICKYLQIPYILYSNLEVLDEHINMEVDINHFNKFHLSCFV